MTQKPGQDRAERVRRRAHDIWERDGRPDGRHDEHWAQAEAEVDDEIRAEKRNEETESSAPEVPPKRRSKATAAKPVTTKPEAASKAAGASGTRAAAENLSAVAAGRMEQTGTTKTGGQISRGGAASGKPGKASRRDASRG